VVSVTVPHGHILAFLDRNKTLHYAFCLQEAHENNVSLRDAEPISIKFGTVGLH
jgi:hypothetical protein